MQRPDAGACASDCSPSVMLKCCHTHISFVPIRTKKKTKTTRRGQKKNRAETPADEPPLRSRPVGSPAAVSSRIGDRINHSWAVLSTEKQQCLDTDPCITGGGTCAQARRARRGRSPRPRRDPVAPRSASSRSSRPCPGVPGSARASGEDILSPVRKTETSLLLSLSFAESEPCWLQGDRDLVAEAHAGCLLTEAPVLETGPLSRAPAPSHGHSTPHTPGKRDA